MNVNVLIDSIVRQTTVLIAQLATAGGGRPSLAHTANQVFTELVRELKAQGVSNKVLADMFGLALRTYHAKVQRLSESNSYAGRSLWEAVLAYIQDEGPMLQSDVVQRFKLDDYATVKGVLTDLVENGLVFRTGRSSRAVVRAASDAEVQLPGKADPGAAATMVWVAINRIGPATPDELSQFVAVDEKSLTEALEQLVGDGRVRVEGGPSEPRYQCDRCVIPVGDAKGWEAAVFDHYQAMVTAIGTKLRLGASQNGEHVGGSTYNFWICDDHPYRDEVLGLLQRFRSEAAGLRQRVGDYNRDQKQDESSMTRVIAYVGQTVLDAEPEGEPS